MNGNEIIVWLLEIDNRHRHFQSLPQAQVSCTMTGIPYYWVAVRLMPVTILLLFQK